VNCPVVDHHRKAGSDQVRRQNGPVPHALSTRSSRPGSSITTALAGGHASWWNCAIIGDGDRSRYGMMQLGLWADGFAVQKVHKYPFLAGWGEDHERDVGSRTPWVNDRPVRRAGER
jgi:hypothetical protein